MKFGKKYAGNFTGNIELQYNHKKSNYTVLI